MNQENRKMVVEEYLSASRKVSNITRGIAVALSIIALYTLQPIGLLLKVFWLFDICQYLLLSLRADLELREVLSIRLGNKLVIVPELLFYGKLIIVVVLLGGL